MDYGLNLPLVQARRPSTPPRAEPRVAAGDVAAVLGVSEWALLPSALQALMGELPALVGLPASEARAALGPYAGSSRQQSGAVAVLGIRGVIWPRGGLADMLGLTTTARIAASLRAALADPNVSAVLFDIDSPGGTVAGTPELAREIYQARAVKPITAAVNYTCASAAYWLAASASDIVAAPSGEAGSVGVYSVHMDHSRALEMEGIKPTLIFAGRHKVEGNPFEPLGAEARAHLQERVSSYYTMFADDVARGRGVSPRAVRDGFGQGRMLGAEAARRAGLVDRIGTLDDTLARLAKAKPTTGGARVSADADADYRRRRARALALGAGANHALQLAEVAGDQIPLIRRLVAERALDAAERDLVLPARPALRWFEARAAYGKAGFYLPGEIWLSDVLQDRAAVARVVAHEARHAWQAARDVGFTPQARAWSEQDADQYEHEFMRRFAL